MLLPQNLLLRKMYCLTELLLFPLCNEFNPPKRKKNLGPGGMIDYAVENETHVSVFASTFRDI